MQHSFTNIVMHYFFRNEHWYHEDRVSSFRHVTIYAQRNEIDSHKIILGFNHSNPFQYASTNSNFHQICIRFQQSIIQLQSSNTVGFNINNREWYSRSMHTFHNTREPSKYQLYVQWNRDLFQYRMTVISNTRMILPSRSHGLWHFIKQSNPFLTQ